MWDPQPRILYLAALPALPSHRPWAALPACTLCPLWVPSGCFAALGTAAPSREEAGRWVGLGHGAGLLPSSSSCCNLALL